MNSEESFTENGFGAGMGRQQETCGAVTGAIMVLGLLNEMCPQLLGISSLCVLFSLLPRLLCEVAAVHEELLRRFSSALL